jgi:hypothetical protein
MGGASLKLHFFPILPFPFPDIGETQGGKAGLAQIQPVRFAFATAEDYPAVSNT